MLDRHETARFFARLRENREKDGCQNRDDGDHHEQLDQGKRTQALNQGETSAFQGEHSLCCFREGRFARRRPRIPPR
jgi:hypothetical protein